MRSLFSRAFLSVSFRKPRQNFFMLVPSLMRPPKDGFTDRLRPVQCNSVMGRQSRPLRNKWLTFPSKRQMRKEHSAPHAREMILDLIERVPKSAAARRVERILELLVAAEQCRVEIFRDSFAVGLSVRGETLDESDRLHIPQKGFECSLPLCP